MEAKEAIEVTEAERRGSGEVDQQMMQAATEASEAKEAKVLFEDRFRRFLGFHSILATNH